MKNTLFDTSSELLVRRCGEGIQLCRPNNNQNYSSKVYSVSELMSLPLNIYFMDCDSIIQNLNEHAVESCGFPSVTETIGQTVRVAAKKEAADVLIRQDQLVLEEKRMKIMDQCFMRIDDISFSAIGIRMPWYGSNNKIIGVFVIAFALGLENASLATSIEVVARTGLLTNTLNLNSLETIIPGRELKGVYLSNRELECMRLLFTGKTAKMIAKTLQLSPRTVEHYIENIKAKYNVSSKTDLIEKIISN